VLFGAFLHIIFKFRDLSLGYTTIATISVSAEGELHGFRRSKYVYKLYSVCLSHDTKFDVLSSYPSIKL